VQTPGIRLYRPEGRFQTGAHDGSRQVRHLMRAKSARHRGTSDFHQLKLSSAAPAAIAPPALAIDTRA